MEKFICIQCNKEFLAYKTTGGKPRKFCSKECQSKHRVGKKNPESWKGIYKFCPICDKKFYVYPSEIETKKTCSRKCKYKLERQLGLHQGERCNFWQGGYESYRGKNWYYQRSEARKRDNNICQICGKTADEHQKKLIVHHVVPFRFFENDYKKANHLNNLITLCHNCHAKQESHHWVEVPEQYKYLLKDVVPRAKPKRKIGTNRYSKEEVDFIIKNRRSMEYKDIANAINRPYWSVTSKIYELDQKAKKQDNTERSI